MGDQNPGNFQNPPPFAPKHDFVYPPNEDAHYQPLQPQQQPPPPYNPSLPLPEPSFNPSLPQPPTSPQPQPPSSPQLPNFQLPPGYDQPPYPPQSYPMQPYPQQLNPQQISYPQQNVVNVNQAPVYYQRPRINFVGAIVFSCIVFWFFGFIFGTISFILAIVGQSSTSNDDNSSAKCLLIASYVISTIGLLVGIAAYIFIIYFFAYMPHYWPSSYRYSYYYVD